VKHYKFEISFTEAHLGEDEWTEETLANGNTGLNEIRDLIIESMQETLFQSLTIEETAALVKIKHFSED
jgi:hypothetical protein